MHRITKLENNRVSLALIEWLEAQCFPVDEAVEDKEDIVWWMVTDDTERPVAYAGLKGNYLCTCGVLPSARGKGLQKKLIRARVRQAKKHGVPLVITYTVHDNPASMNSLITCGFKTYEPDYAWAGRKNVVYFFKDLK